MKVAIVMGAHNCAQYIERTITSIINQTHQDWTLYVVDDASTDATSVSLLRMMNKDQRVIPIRSDVNLGCDDARNKAIKTLKESTVPHEYIAFCDSDDVWMPNHLETAVKTLQETKAKMYYCDVEFQNSNDESIVVYGIPRLREFNRDVLLKGNYIFVSSVVIDASCVEDFDKYCDPKGDWDMWLRLSAKHDVVNSPEVNVKYRWKNEGSYYTENQSQDAFHRVQSKHTRKVDKTIVIHPYSHKIPGSIKENPKNYPHWKEVVANLKKNGFYVIQIGVSGEPLIGADEMVLNASNEKLKQLLDKVDTFACVDSFFQHFAHFYGRHGVVVWGPSDPTIFGHKENINLLKSRDVLRPSQFSTWREWDYKADVFPDQQDVVDAIKMMSSTKTGQTA